MIRMDSDFEVTPQLVQKLLSANSKEREQRLSRYYKGEHAIVNRKFDDETKPNNKIVTNECKRITNVSVGYFIGKPVSYSANKENKEYLEHLQTIFDLNNEQKVNADLAKSASIYGYGVEVIYTSQSITGELEIRFAYLDLEEQDILLVYDRSVEKNLIMAIRHYTYKDVVKDTTIKEAYVYTSDAIYHFRENDGEMTLIDADPHYFREVPINVYYNRDNISDFEDIVTLNDAYNILQSDDINESEYTNDAFLLIKGMIADDEDVQKMKEKRVIHIEDAEGAGVEWLVKNLNDTWKENLKTRIKNDIHSISATPDFSDSSFAGNQTGEAMKYKIKGLEDNRASKEREFKPALQRRIRLITNILNYLGNSFDWREIVPTFTANLPKADLTIADINTLVGTGILSKDTARAIIPSIEDPADEAEKIQQETEDYIDLNTPKEVNIYDEQDEEALQGDK
ncbi:phage portal protein [Priestia megaterium]|uniref:phage portal protein n=1 Tax=Priestia megaterium TaxID=1404 RepID=UPI000BF2D2DD|nr:phage portal protein [Priestia megaterium]PFI93404.1 phage portal protein [Priestia megaterium]PGR11779.1 phage portal protein [Priestia megaterium]